MSTGAIVGIVVVTAAVGVGAYVLIDNQRQARAAAAKKAGGLGGLGGSTAQQVISAVGAAVPLASSIAALFT